MEADVPLGCHVAEVSGDIESIPVDLLEGLSDTLAERGKRLRGSDPAASGAYELLAGWLICRRLELRHGSPQRTDAARLRADYERFVRELVCMGPSVAA